MDSVVFVAVLFAAACHAGWNAAIKRGLDPLAMTVVISLGATVVAVLGLPLVGFPALASWPWCIASVLVHLGYFAALAESYRAGDMKPGLSNRTRFGAADDGDGDNAVRR
jgi:hypothetical protein